MVHWRNLKTVGQIIAKPNLHMENEQSLTFIMVPATESAPRQLYII